MQLFFVFNFSSLYFNDNLLASTYEWIIHSFFHTFSFTFKANVAFEFVVCICARDCSTVSRFKFALNSLSYSFSALRSPYVLYILMRRVSHMTMVIWWRSRACLVFLSCFIWRRRCRCFFLRFFFSYVCIHTYCSGTMRMSRSAFGVRTKPTHIIEHGGPN